MNFQNLQKKDLPTEKLTGLVNFEKYHPSLKYKLQIGSIWKDHENQFFQIIKIYSKKILNKRSKRQWISKEDFIEVVCLTSSKTWISGMVCQVNLRTVALVWTQIQTKK